MCGIVGYTGTKQAAPILLDGLKKLEYRGYDSSGIAVIDGGNIKMMKAKGRLTVLEKVSLNGEALKGNAGIGHTRWATHGEPSDINSHPHLSSDGNFAVVHNGIIENYLTLKEFLINKGYVFLSETDTEVIAHLLEYYYNGNILDTLRKVINSLEGSYALGVLFKPTPETFYAVRKDSPLVIGLGQNENFIASDMPALLKYTRDFILLGDDEIAKIDRDKVAVYNKNLETLDKQPFRAEWDLNAAEKGGYEHFMLKEIYDQPKAVKDTVCSRVRNGVITLDKIKLTADEIKQITKINIIGCGSAYHAGIVGKYFIEKVCRIPVEVDLASEFRYRSPIVSNGTLTVIISQSGETADTLAALREAKKLGSRVLGIVNVVGSSIARESDDVLYTLAGPEIAVATTKGYTTQVASLYLLGLYIAEKLGSIKPSEYAKKLDALCAMPASITEMLSDVKKVQYLSSLYFKHKDAFFIGRGTDYAAALEGALKLKEISYIHAEAYPAGELKHGTISLIEEGSMVIAVAAGKTLFEKTLSNIKEVTTRGASVIAVASTENKNIEKECAHTLYLPKCDDDFSPLLTAVYLQLLAYYIAAARGLDIDKPRNLAKSVTVE